MKEHKATDYHQPRYTTSPPKEWLKDRRKFATGFCNQYQPLKAQGHEGDKVPRKVCEFWDTCPCMCHYQIDQMFEMVGMPRPPAEQSPEYAEMVSKIQLETQAMLDTLPTFGRFSGPLSSSDDTIPHPEDEVPFTGHAGGTLDVSAARVQPLFAPTPTGRRARGQLEYDVLLVCMEFAAGKFEWEHCTPKMVSEEIGNRYAIEPPSTGAINAVWDRWDKLGVIEQAKKPSRLVRFLIEDLNPQKLDAIKSKHKREIKRSVSEHRRGTIRGARSK